MYRSSLFRSILNTGYITGSDMCEVCTEAVHSVAFWTRVTSQAWTCVKYVPKQTIFSDKNTIFATGLDISNMCEVVWNIGASEKTGHSESLVTRVAKTMKNDV